jgi:hypothetical protein
MKKRGRSWPFLAAAMLCLALVWLALRQRAEILALRAASETQEAAGKQDRIEIDRLRRQVASDGLELGSRDRSGRWAADEARAKMDTAHAPVDLMPFILKDPQFDELHRRRLLQQVRGRYGDLKSLNLKPDQQDKLTALLAGELSAPQDAREAALAQGIADSSPEMSRAIGEAMKSADDEIKALIGDSGFQDLTSLSSQVTTRKNLNSTLGSDFIAGGLPLSPDQINALADVQAHFQGSPTELDEAMKDRAAQELSPAQMDLFLQNQALNRASQDLLQRASDEAKKETGTTSLHWAAW